jgi:hypothetical protein
MHYVAEHVLADATVLRMIHGDSEDYPAMSVPCAQAIDGAQRCDRQMTLRTLQGRNLDQSKRPAGLGHTASRHRMPADRAGKFSKFSESMSGPSRPSRRMLSL